MAVYKLQHSLGRLEQFGDDLLPVTRIDGESFFVFHQESQSISLSAGQDATRVLAPHIYSAVALAAYNGERTALDFPDLVLRLSSTVYQGVSFRDSGKPDEEHSLASILSLEKYSQVVQMLIQRIKDYVRDSLLVLRNDGRAIENGTLHIPYERFLAGLEVWPLTEPNNSDWHPCS